MSLTESDTTDQTVLAPPTAEEIASIDAWWRANNYLTIGQIYLKDNPLLSEALSADQIKPRLLGHWGTSPGLSFVYAHVNRLIKHTGQECVYITGPGHGGPALVAAGYLEGSYTETYPAITQDRDGIRRLFRQFSSPGGIPSHVSVTTPGSIHEGGELGYALVHAFGAVMDNPDLLAVTLVGDGEAETGPLEGSWKGISFINPTRDGAVLPILHLNGAKIAGPTVLGRKSDAEVRSLLEGHGYDVLEVSGEDLPGMHHRFAEALAEAYGKIRSIQLEARAAGRIEHRPHWPMIILRSPKGWTGPDQVDGIQVTGTWRSHQVPLSAVKENPEHLVVLEKWLRSYRPEELFDADGRPVELVRAANPEGDLRMSASPHANGGLLTTDLDLPDFRDFAVELTDPGTAVESTRRMGEMTAEIYRRNPDNFRLFCPDETNSNRLGAVFEVSDRAFMETVTPEDVALSSDGRVMEVLSEHNCHGWLEGYTLTGRHGLFATYEAFAMVSASQTIQHGKWLEEANHLPWRAKVPSLNILLTSTTWRNDHNGFSHQGPGLIDCLIPLSPEVVRVWLPPDANTTISIMDHCLRSTNHVNLVVVDKQKHLQYLSLEEANQHCAAGAGTWDWAGTVAADEQPDIVLACAGDVPTQEALAAAELLRNHVPDLKVRFVNVVDLMALLPENDHPHGFSDSQFDELFTAEEHVVFAFHGYPRAVHQLIHGRSNPGRFHVRGFNEQGTTTTPFDMVVLNRMSRFHLAKEVLRRCRRRVAGWDELAQLCDRRLAEHEVYIREHLSDLPDVATWTWRGAPAPAAG
jgi:xylulose-5-phosphate/fructose-6-phosphate phosphoketolase